MSKEPIREINIIDYIDEDEQQKRHDIKNFIIIILVLITACFAYVKLVNSNNPDSLNPQNEQSIIYTD